MNEEEEKIAVHPRPVYAWVIFALSVIFSAYTYILQSTPGLDDLTPESAEHLTSVIFALTGYYIAFTFFQIPVGLLIDRLEHESSLLLDFLSVLWELSFSLMWKAILLCLSQSL